MCLYLPNTSTPTIARHMLVQKFDHEANVERKDCYVQPSQKQSPFNLINTMIRSKNSISHEGVMMDPGRLLLV